MILGALAEDPLLLMEVFGSCLAEVFPDIEALDDVFPIDCLLLVAPLSRVPGSPSLMVESLLSLLLDSISQLRI